MICRGYGMDILVKHQPGKRVHAVLSSASCKIDNGESLLPKGCSIRRLLYIALAAACLLVGVTTTYGLGGKMWHANAAVLGQEAATAWRFFQPFRFEPFHCPSERQRSGMG